MTKVWSFDQNEYFKEGVCLSLAARWAKMILKAPKTRWTGSPDLSGADRDKYFNPKKLSDAEDRQTVYRARNAQGRLERDELLERVEAIIAKKYDMGFDFQSEKNGIIEEKKRLVDFGQGAITELLQRNKLYVEARTPCNSFSEYFLNSQSGKCYVFGSPDAEHAIAGFVVPKVSLRMLGQFGDLTYKVFDPNSGEHDFNGDSALAGFMASLKTKYGANGAATRYEVSYSKH